MNMKDLKKGIDGDSFELKIHSKKFRDSPIQLLPRTVEIELINVTPLKLYQKILFKIGFSVTQIAHFKMIKT